jgi:hypothetical protein
LNKKAVPASVENIIVCSFFAKRSAIAFEARAYPKIFTFMLVAK